MYIYLGNLDVDEIEKRAGVPFPAALKDYMKPRWQQKAADVEPGKWHCFDLPFVLVCGDMETATEIYNHLKDFSDDFKEQLQISLNKAA